jgi:hypothetical protein
LFCGTLLRVLLCTRVLLCKTKPLNFDQQSAPQVSDASLPVCVLVPTVIFVHSDFVAFFDLFLIAVGLEYTWARLTANSFYIRLNEMWSQAVDGGQLSNSNEQMFKQKGQATIDQLVQNPRELLTSSNGPAELRNRINHVFQFSSEFKVKIHGLTLTSFNYLAKRLGTYDAVTVRLVSCISN